MRAVADVLAESGVYSLSLRMPGHGTVPSGLVRSSWKDWLAAVRMGVRHVRASIPQGAPLILVGYSNGGALVLKYTLEAIEREGDPRPAKLILLSPMIGVTPAARLAWWISLLGRRCRTSRKRTGWTSFPNTTRSSTTRSPRTPGFRRRR